ncbi:MAG: T9SS type A sorting domain-containing protein [Saprospiraceae bacterium]
MKNVFVLFLICSVYALPYSQDSFKIVGIHPRAAEQNSVTGKIITTLFPWQGKLYAGYGDYGANTGPIDIYAFDPDSQAFTFKWEANTEAIYNFRAYNGQVFAPAIDRKSYGKPGDFTKLDSNGVWADYNFGSNSTHVYDVARLSGSDIYMVGSQEERAAVWRSQNNGMTWQRIHTDTAISGIADDFARYYFAGVLDGKLYVQAKDFYGSIHPYSDVWNGTQWERDTSMFGSSTYVFGWRPDTLAGKMVLLSNSPGYSSLLRTFDGEAGSILQNTWVFDFMVDTGFLYALVDSGFGKILVKRTPDLVNWHTLASAPLGSRSLAVMNDKIYIGMNDSRIMEYTKLLSDIITGVHDEEEKVTDIVLFPNPCVDELNIILPWEDITIASVFDYSGKLLHHQKLYGAEGSIDVSSLLPGFYLLKLEIRDFVLTQKFVKSLK